MMKWQKLSAILFLLFFSVAFCFSEVVLSDSELLEIQELLKTSSEQLKATIISESDLQNMSATANRYIALIEQRLKIYESITENSEQTLKDYEQQLKTAKQLSEDLTTLSAQLTKQLSDLQKSFLKSQIETGILCCVGGLIIGVICGIVFE